MKTKQLLASLLAALGLGINPTASADAVVDWNEIAMPVIAANRAGPAASFDTALLHIAMHDAVQAIEQRYEPYHAEVTNASGSREAAAVAAARGVLVGMYPTQQAAVDATYQAYLRDHGLAQDAGLVVGQTVAMKILPLRRRTPDPLPPPVVGANTPGSWRPTPSFNGNPPSPPSQSPMLAPWIATLDPFVLSAPARFRVAPPPALDSEHYRADFEEVKLMGALASPQRTPEQTDVAYFFTDFFLTQTNRMLRGVATSQFQRTGDRARMFALANLAISDALIGAWDGKLHYNLWRPITAITEAADDGNPATTPDPNWKPLLNTPNYPDYPSGLCNVTGAVTRTLNRLVGRDRLEFEMTSLAAPVQNRTRRYSRLSDLERDVVDARVFSGIHFRFADTAALKQGQRVGDWVFEHALRPLRGQGRKEDAQALDAATMTPAPMPTD